MRPFTVSFAMFGISAAAIMGIKVSPELVKCVFEYIDKLERAQQPLAVSDSQDGRQADKLKLSV